MALGGGFSLCACSSSYSRPKDDLEEIQYAVLSILPLEFTRTMNIVFVMPDVSAIRRKSFQAPFLNVASRKLILTVVRCPKSFQQVIYV